MTLDQELAIAAARYVLSDLQSWDLPGVADRALASGTYSQALGELATTHAPTMADTGPLFERALKELHIPIPTRDEAFWTLLRYYLTQLASGVVVGHEGLRPVIDLYNNSDLHDQSNEYVGDSHGLQHFIGTYYSYDDVPDSEMADLDRQAVRQAADWLAEHGA